MPRPEIRFCRLCGTVTEQRVPPAEDRLRAVCPACGYVDYVNPIAVVGTVPVWRGEAVLLCRRAIEPRHGLWTLPAGFLELGETLAEGAARETREEAGAPIELGGVYSLLDVLHVGQIHVFFRATLTSQDLDPGPETLEARIFPFAEIPWDELAFRTVHRTLEHLVDDAQAGVTDALHTGTIS